MRTLKIYSILFVLFSSTLVYSQEHMSFKGIPINGTTNEFAQKLISQGYQKIETKDNIIILEGEFINKKCKVYLIGSVKTNKIWKVYVILPENSSWYSIKGDYKELKVQFQQKYGEGRSYEFFSKPYYEGDGYEFQAIRKDKCTYATFFDSTNGNIMLEIGDESIRISYEDKINSEINNKEKESIVNGDI